MEPTAFAARQSPRMKSFYADYKNPRSLTLACLAQSHLLLYSTPTLTPTPTPTLTLTLTPSPTLCCPFGNLRAYLAVSWLPGTETETARQETGGEWRRLGRGRKEIERKAGSQQLANRP